MAPAGAATLDTFDSVITGAQAPGVWYTDRYAPAGFATANFGGDNRLALILSATAGPDGRPAAYSSSFYNTQGRKIDTAPGTGFASVQMYIASNFASDPNRVGGIWATGDAVRDIYPILEFANGKFQGWDSTGAGAWTILGLPTGFTTDSWHTLSMALNLSTNMIDYAVDGQGLGSVSADGILSFANIILQGINPGINRTLYFDNLATGAAPEPTPLPAALVLFGSVLGCGGLLMHRRQRRQGSKLSAL